MLSKKLNRLFEKLGFQKDSKSKTTTKTRRPRRKNAKPVDVPDNVLSKIFDYSSPFDVAKWRSVNRQFNRVAVEKEKAILYLDVLRVDITDIIPIDAESDGDFYKHPRSNILLHTEKRSALLAAHSHWNPSDAEKMLKAVKYFGRYARTVSLDASIAELCVAGQSTNDIQHWFQFQTIAGSSDGPMNSISEMPHFGRSNLPRRLAVTQTDLPKWNPRTQRIPNGPLFPMAVEVAFRASIPQLRRLRRLGIYRQKPSCIFSENQLQLFRLTITGGRRSPPSALRLRAFLDWVDADSLGGKYCTQFC